MSVGEFHACSSRSSNRSNSSPAIGQRKGKGGTNTHAETRPPMIFDVSPRLPVTSWKAKVFR